MEFLRRGAALRKEKLFDRRGTDRGEGRIYDRSGRGGRKEGRSDGGEGGWQGVFDGKYLFAPRSRRINLFVGGAVRFLGRYYTRGRE